MEPKVSVIIPVYNVEKYLQECIDSLVNQTLQEIELIFINDASPDNSLKILKHNQEKYPDKIRIINSEVNLRQGGARNLGIRAARAQYIGFVDSDDYVSEDMYNKMYEKIVNTEADAVFIQYASVPEKMVLSQAKEKVTQSHIVWQPRLLRWNNEQLTDEGRMDLMTLPISGVVGGLWKKSILIDNNLFFPEKLRYEDNYWGTLMMCYLQKVTFIPEISYYYRQNGASTVHKKNATHHLDRIVIENMLLDEAKCRGLLTKYEKAFEYIFFRRYVMNTFNIVISTFDDIPISELERIKHDLIKNFPKWKKNIYLNRLSIKEKLKCGVFVLPASWIVKLYKWRRGM